MKAELSNFNVQIPITRKRVPEQYQITKCSKYYKKGFRLFIVHFKYCLGFGA